MQVKEMIEVLQAYDAGATIQILDDYGQWIDCAKPSFDFALCEYRVKPATTKPKPRKDQNETGTL